MDTLYFLQHYWWALVALLGAILVFLLFVQGAQGLLLRTASSEEEKDFVVKYPPSHPSPCSIQPVSAEPTGCGSVFCCFS